MFKEIDTYAFAVNAKQFNTKRSSNLKCFRVSDDKTTYDDSLAIKTKINWNDSKLDIKSTAVIFLEATSHFVKELVSSVRVRSDKSPTQFVRNGLRTAGVHVRSCAGKWNALR